jgi:RimJ/RimL family protein N-acetyltransferase
MIDGERLPTLPASRVTLRWLTAADTDALYEIFADPEVARYWWRGPFAHRDEARDLLAAVERSFRERRLFQWGIARATDDVLLGTCTLFHLDTSNKRAELGYALGRRHWRQGLMHEALDRLFEFAFGPLALLRLEADVDPENGASIRCLERLGFRREGYLRERWLVAGDVRDALYYGLLRREWEEHRR